MRETLQKNEGRSRQVSRNDGTTELILDDNYPLKAIEFIKDAKSEIRLCAYAWRWYQNEPEINIQKMNIALLKATLSNVQVRCLVDTERQAQYFASLGFKAKAVVNTRMLHTKALCIDHKTLVLGSHNFTKRATTDNYEMSLATQEQEPVLQFIEYFDKMWLSRG